MAPKSENETRRITVFGWYFVVLKPLLQVIGRVFRILTTCSIRLALWC